ncbi:zinc finger and BTB domain-containing protein 2b isoform X2 [Clupea harengus]|uniref:Zinc finger and BTB domain-containing protein 2b isoform X1 n=1 Tax=Clupea harengus TaxID=7950 RepID=A0A6P3WB85_CLUHA|nr:zinc finger and BTB domain-containing protein 2b isoform X1 [Clupea harengus]XP_031437749.1 zinc finger and BTB domain-containing protein 2b isoform X2 [Clupea harengus]
MEQATHGLILLQQLNTQREFGFLCDCTVAIGDVFFKAHKAVLAAFSNYFRMLFIHQDSDCVRLKPGDIQPDIFSYLLNLMYTGRLSAQLIDPARLEQGVKFLHAYPLLQEASVGSANASATPAPAPEPSLPTAAIATSLYGIQISDQQEGAPASTCLSPPSDPEGRSGPGWAIRPRASEEAALVSDMELDAYSSGVHEREEVGGGLDTEFSEAPSSSSSSSANANANAHTILHVKPSIMQHHRGSSGSFRKQHSCHVCGARFLQRSALREHLLLHTQALLPLLGDGGGAAAAAPMMPGGMATPQIEELLRGGGVAMAAAAAGVASDGGERQPAAMSSASEIPFSIFAASGSCVGQPQADTPPPSDIADIDHLEGGAGDGAEEREVKRRKYECATCGRKFIQKSHWREHMYIHTGKPYRCSACGKSFCRANQAARHVCLGTPDAERPGLHLCAPDDSSSSSQQEAMFLGSARQPYRCNVCHATFSSPQQVLKHLCFTQGHYSPSARATRATHAHANAQADREGGRDEGSDSSSGSRDDGSLIRTIKTEEVLGD